MISRNALSVWYFCGSELQVRSPCRITSQVRSTAKSVNLETNFCGCIDWCIDDSWEKSGSEPWFTRTRSPCSIPAVRKPSVRSSYWAASQVRNTVKSVNLKKTSTDVLNGSERVLKTWSTTMVFKNAFPTYSSPSKYGNTTSFVEQLCTSKTLIMCVNLKTTSRDPLTIMPTSPLRPDLQP